MSLASQKTGNRTVHLRERAMNGIEFWDDRLPLSPTAVFVPLERLDRLDATEVIDQVEIEGGVLVRFRRKRDADRYR